MPKNPMSTKESLKMVGDMAGEPSGGVMAADTKVASSKVNRLGMVHSSGKGRSSNTKGTG